MTDRPLSLGSIGHVEIERRGNDQHFRCRVCGSEEIVSNFYDGKNLPAMFTVLTRQDGTEYSKCESCGLLYDRVVSGAK